MIILLHLQPKKVKNVSYDSFGSKLGRVHMQRQDFSKLQTRKIKGLKRPRDEIRSKEDSGLGTKKPKVDT